MRAFAALLLLAPAIALTYGRTLDFAFVWDDHVQIERNPWLRAPDGLRALLTRPSWGFAGGQAAQPSNYYRPAFLATYALVARIGDATPRAYHALSLTLHLVASMLVAWLGWRLCARPRAGLLAGLVFALHPAQAESVAWVAAQGDLLAAVASLLALRLQLAHDRRLLPLAALATLAACLAKETGMAVLAPLAFVAWRGAPAGMRWRGWPHLLPHLIAVGIYLALRTHALGAFMPVTHAEGARFLPGTALALALLARHALLTVLPWALPVHVIAQVEVPLALTPTVVVGALVAIGVIALAVHPRTPPAVALGVTWWGAMLVPTLVSAGVGRFNFAERYQYLPLAGAAWLVAAAYAWASTRWPTSRLRPVLAAGLLLACGVGAHARQAVWRDDAHFFAAAVTRDPRSLPARNGLGLALHAAGDLAGAEAQFAAALALEPGAAEAWTNLGAVREARGDLAGALAAYARALGGGAPQPVAGVRLARLHRRLGNIDAARRQLDALLADGSGGYDAALERALIALDEADLARARALLEPAIAQFPAQPRGHYLLAQAHLRLGDLEAAERAARAAIAVGAGPGPRRVLALICAQRGDLPGARVWLSDALRLDPHDAATLALGARLAATPEAR